MVEQLALRRQSSLSLLSGNLPKAYRVSHEICFFQYMTTCRVFKGAALVPRDARPYPMLPVSINVYFPRREEKMPAVWHVPSHQISHDELFPTRLRNWLSNVSSIRTTVCRAGV